MRISCCAAAPAASSPARCSIGKHLLAAICCRHAFQPAPPPAVARCTGSPGYPLSLRLDAGRLDDRPPLVGLGLAQCAKRIWGLLGTRRDHLTEIGELAAHCRITERG